MEASKKHYPDFWQAVGLILILSIIEEIVSRVHEPTKYYGVKAFVPLIGFLITLRFGFNKTGKPFKEVFVGL
jgi:hypothetical protein